MAGAYCNYLVNKISDHIFRAIGYTMPSQLWMALISPNKGYWATGVVYGTSDYVVPTVPNGRLYRCTTGGTSGGTEPTWGLVDGGTTSDNGTVWTDQTLVLKAGIVAEVSGNNYARVRLDPSESNWKGTGNETTGASAGTTGLIKNNAVITFPTPSGAWNLITHAYLFDAVAGNPLQFGALTTEQFVNAGAVAPVFANGAAIFSLN